MQLLVIGGAGYVGGMILPELARRHRLRVFDLRPPAVAVDEYMTGRVDDLAALRHAAAGVDAVVYMAMGEKDFSTPAAITSNFDVNVKGVYLALYAAHLAGVGHAVYTSTMSVYDGDLLRRYFADETIPPDSRHMYGLTKRFGEEICRVAALEWGMSVNALRLCLPLPDAEWVATVDERAPILATAATDLARALLAALEYRDGFQAFMISGDYTGRLMNMAKAKQLLHWEPLARPAVKEGDHASAG